MAWEKRGSGSYYYRKRRSGDRVVSEYVGTGLFAELLGEADALERDQRALEREAERQEREEMLAVDREIDQVVELIRALTHGMLLISGYHTHKGQWRKRRDG